MSTGTEEQARREAVEIALWAQGRQAPPREVLAELGLLGPDGRVLADDGQEAGAGNAYGEDGSRLPDLGPLAPFGSWQSVAATILRKTADSAGFDQTSTVFDVFQWILFEIQFASMPFLYDITEDSRDVSISSLSLSPAVRAVTDLVGGLVTEDALTGIVDSIKKIGQLAVENPGQPEKNSNVQQGVLTVADGNVRLGLLRTAVRMEYRSGKGYQQLNQEISVSRLFGNLDYGMCLRNADILLEWDGQDVDDWVNGTSSSPFPANTSPAWDN
ncbi:hypothetical protein [Actinosynnema sp. NPDC020468]|uniref:hypothetical protein n=1 Tax=Actinosynnema sp. NPDC020468 TaxID=3154488 RepID=UPI0033E6B0C7